MLRLLGPKTLSFIRLLVYFDAKGKDISLGSRVLSSVLRGHGLNWQYRVDKGACWV